MVLTTDRRPATARQVRAAERRDRDALLVAAREYLAACPPLPSRIRGDILAEREIGALLLTGGAAAKAGELRRAATRQLPDLREQPLASLPEAEWDIVELTLLREIRLLERDWRTLPGMPDRPDKRALWTADRKRLLASNALLVAMAKRDATGAKAAIRRLGALDDAKFSLLAYALYRVVAEAGLTISIPRAYNF